MIGDPDLSVRRVHRRSRSRVGNSRLKKATVVLPTAARTSRLRRLGIAAAALLLLAAGTGWFLGRPVPLDAGAVLWTVDLATPGAQPVRALAIGGGGGLRLLAIPAAGDSTAVPLRVVARPDVSPLRVVTLGRGVVSLRATPSAGSTEPERRAQARVVTLRDDGVVAGF